MTAVKAGDVDRALRTRPADVSILLFYGPDSGRVSERARAAAEANVLDPADPFQLIRLDGDAVADEPGKLIEEATTFGLFGDRRTIWVRPTSRNIAGPVSVCAEAALEHCLVVVEAGDLSKTSPLRTVCERSPRALALPCYADEVRDLATVLTETFRAERLTLDDDARDLLVDSIGGDRLATRGELAKLVLYAHGRDRITVADVAAVVSNVSATNLDETLDAAFLGRGADLVSDLGRLAQTGVTATTLLLAALRHALALLSARAAVDDGQGVDAALRSWRGLHFRRRKAVESQVGRWRSAELTLVLRLLQDAVLEGRRGPNLSWTFASHTLIEIAGRATRSSQTRSDFRV